MRIKIDQITRLSIIEYKFTRFSRWTKPNRVPVKMVELTPIDEEPSEADEDQPITMIPKIMHTAPSPTVENPHPTIASNSAIRSDQKQSDTTSADPLIEKVPEQQTVVEQPNENGNIHSNSNDKTSAINGNASEKEISQIESVL